MSLSKFGKVVGVASVVVVFVSVDTCGKRAFKKTVVKEPQVDTLSVNIEGMNYMILRGKSGDIEVVNTTLEKNTLKNLEVPK